MRALSLHVIRNCTVARKVTPLFIDGYFWLALLLGPLACGIFLRQTGVADGIDWPGLHWYTVWFLVLATPVIEEWFFRGIMQPILLELSKGRLCLLGFTFANLMTSLVFACMHIPGQGLAWATLVIFPSLVFGWFRDRYNHVAPAILLHIAYNLFFFSFLSLSR